MDNKIENHARFYWFDGKVVPAQQGKSFIEKFSEKYGKPSKLKKSFLRWEDDNTTLEVSTRGPQSNIMLTDKQLLLNAHSLKWWNERSISKKTLFKMKLKRLISSSVKCHITNQYTGYFVSLQILDFNFLFGSHNLSFYQGAWYFFH